MPIPTTKKAKAQIEFSMALPKWLVVNTAYHEKHSAIRINGTITHAAFEVVFAPVIMLSWYRTIAHCTAKQISATVATNGRRQCSTATCRTSKSAARQRAEGTT